MPTVIAPARPDSPEARELIDELEGHLASIYPVESRHGYSVAKLVAEDVSFFVTRVDGRPAGCGGVKLVGREYGEIKRMYVRPEFRGLGLGRRMVEHLVEFARRQGVELMRLETGIHQQEAIALYETAGFTRIPPFADYTDDPLSRCYERRIR
jgi:putative acetyltransferase